MAQSNQNLSNNSGQTFNSISQATANDFGAAAVFINPKREVKGSVYLFEDWENTGIIHTNDGQRFMLRNINLNLQRNTFESRIVIIHADGASGEVDLIPARFKNSKVAATNNRLWRIAAGIFALAVVIQVSMDWWRINEAEQQLVITRDSQRSLIKSAFPEIGRIVNPEAQVKRALSALEQIGPPPAEFLNILTQSLIVPTRDELEIDLTGMTFADGVLLLRTQSREMGDLEKYRADLNKILTAEVVTAESTDAAVRGAIRVSK